mgnify:CR=1 FL=1
MKEIFMALIGGGFFAFLQFLITRWDNKRADIKELRQILISMEETNEKQSKLLNLQTQELLGLAHDKLVFLTNQIIKRGAITVKEKANLKAIYYPYKDMGGNGDGEEGFLVCMDLAIISEEEAYERDRNLKRNMYGIDIKEGKNADEQTV